MTNRLVLLGGLAAFVFLGTPALASGCSSFTSSDAPDAEAGADGADGADAAPPPDASGGCSACFSNGESCCASATIRCVTPPSSCMLTELTAECTARSCAAGTTCCVGRGPAGTPKSLTCQSSCAAPDVACEGPEDCGGGSCTPETLAGTPLALRTCH